MGKQRKIIKFTGKVKHVIHFNLLIVYNLLCDNKLGNKLGKIMKYSRLQSTML